MSSEMRVKHRQAWSRRSILPTPCSWNWGGAHERQIIYVIHPPLTPLQASIRDAVMLCTICRTNGQSTYNNGIINIKRSRTWTQMEDMKLGVGIHGNGRSKSHLMNVIWDKKVRFLGKGVACYLPNLLAWEISWFLVVFLVLPSVARERELRWMADQANCKGSKQSFHLSLVCENGVNMIHLMV